MANHKRNNRPQGKCVFCGGVGMSKEHIWSNWLKQIIPNHPNHWTCYRQHLGGYQTMKTEDFEGALHSRRVRVVCSRCNSGWMSQVVDLAKSVSEGLIAGDATVLNREQMTALATWVTLASMMAEFDGKGERIVPKSDFDFIRARKTPPPTWTVFLGRYDGESWKDIRYNRHRCRPVDAAKDLIGFANSWFKLTTYNLKHLLVQTFCTGSEYVTKRYLNHSRPKSLIRLWPPDLASAAWPNGQGLNDEQGQRLADSFYHVEMRALGHEQQLI